MEAAAQRLSRSSSTSTRACRRIERRTPELRSPGCMGTVTSRFPRFMRRWLPCWRTSWKPRRLRAATSLRGVVTGRSGNSAYLESDPEREEADEVFRLIETRILVLGHRAQVRDVALEAPLEVKRHCLRQHASRLPRRATLGSDIHVQTQRDEPLSFLVQCTREIEAVLSIAHD